MGETLLTMRYKNPKFKRYHVCHKQTVQINQLEDNFHKVSTETVYTPTSFGEEIMHSLLFVP